MELYASKTIVSSKRGFDNSTGKIGLQLELSRQRKVLNWESTCKDVRELPPRGHSPKKKAGKYQSTENVSVANVLLFGFRLEY
jgi:hypothetical protein